MKDWTIPRRGDEPGDFWSQSMCYGSVDLSGAPVNSIQVRFRNDGGKKVLRAEAHLVYRTPAVDATQVTFDWTDDKGPHRASHVFSTTSRDAWELNTGTAVRTRWIEFATVAR